MSKQSVILNFNPSNQNSKAFDYSQAFNKELEINPNSEVCLYEGELRRKPLVITDDSELTLEVVYSMPSDHDRLIPEVPSVGKPNNLSNAYIQCVIEQGNYTKSEYLQELNLKVNDQITDFNNRANDYNNNGAINFYHTPATKDHAAGVKKTFNHLPYKWHHEDTQQGFYLGLKLDLVMNDFYVDKNGITGETDFYNVGITTEVSDPTHDHNGRLVIYPNVDNSGAQLPNYAKSFMPMFGLGYNKFESGRYGVIDIGGRAADTCMNQMNFGIQMGTTAPGGGSNYNKIIHCQFGNQQFWSGGPATAREFTTGNIYPHFHQNSTGEKIAPTCFFGVKFIKEHDSGTDTSQIVVYQNQGLQNLSDSYKEDGDYYAAGLTEDMESVCITDLTNDEKVFQDGNLGRYKWIIYSDDNGFVNETYDGTTLEQKTPTRKYYYQLLVQVSEDSYGSGMYELIYDSGLDNNFIPYHLVESGFNVLDVASVRDPTKAVSMGLTPMFVFQGCDITTGTSQDPIDFVYSPRYTSSFAVSSNQNQYILYRGINYYSLSSVRENRRILGIAETTTDTLLTTRVGGAGRYEVDLNKGWSVRNPNKFPRFRGDNSGWNHLYQDGIKYNIEIPNLPMRAFNTTARPQYINQSLSLFGTPVIIGNERPVIYNVKSFGEDATDIEEVEVRRQMLPSNLKFLSLNNKEKIKLNELNVQVRRAETNLIATEITDCMIEIIIQNSNK